MNKVLVLGDIINDKYIYGTSDRLSPEAPVPVVKQIYTDEIAGGAGLVYDNLINLGVDAHILDYDQPKCTKTRIICDGHYISRIDDDHIADSFDILENFVKMDLSEYKYVIFSDYNKGVLDNVEKMIAHCNKFDCKVIVDPKRHAKHYKGAWLVKPNNKEFNEFEFNKWHNNIIVTNADKPVTAEFDSKRYISVTDPVEVNDVTGAGDCFLAAFVYALINNFDYQKALDLANRASTESVKHVGTYTLTLQDLSRKTVFTNGCFDILHTGHLTLLKEAKSMGDKLVVGLNSDHSVQLNKGQDRPFNSVSVRREQLELLPYVDEIIIFDDETPYELIKNLKPDLIVKGGDYSAGDVVGHDIAPVHIIPTVEGHSTTKILENKK
jgi:D-beta-D-heptose 7-phosphate kinase/D-beta-D-heptose 1-phosphate adenosyltransferase